MNKAELQRRLKTSGTSPLHAVYFVINSEPNVVYEIVDVEILPSIGLAIKGEFLHAEMPTDEHIEAS